MSSNSVLFVFNVDWYIDLHWLERMLFLKNKGFEVHVLSGFTDKKYIKKFSDMGFFCHSLVINRSGINPFFEFFTLKEIFSFISDLNPKIVHAVTVKPILYVGFLNRLFFRKPVVFSITGLGVVFSSKQFFYTVLSKIMIRFFRFSSLYNSRFIFENNDDYSQFFGLGILKFKNGVVVKGAGIDQNIFKYSVPPLERKVLFAARLIKGKGLHDLVEAKKYLRRKGVDFSLCVAGIVDENANNCITIDEIEDLQSQGLITWLGTVNDMPNLISSMDIVALPTVYGEGVPRILIEGACCGRPIIASKIRGCTEILEDGVNGYFCNPGDWLSLSDSLEKLLLDNNKSIEFGVQGREKVVREFSQDIVLEKTFKIYNDLLGLI